MILLGKSAARAKEWIHQLAKSFTSIAVTFFGPLRSLCSGFRSIFLERIKIIMGERRHSSEKVCPNLQEVGRGPQLLWGFAIGVHLYPFTVEKAFLTVT
jgi:hypothetical protein